MSIDKKNYFCPSQNWMDLDGNIINAHGAGFYIEKGAYYWYGEIRIKDKSYQGISCYSSKDLFNWKNEGICLEAVEDDLENDLSVLNIIERPKVLFNKKTNKYVMWVHVEDSKRSFARAGVAISESPKGPFIYIESIQPNSHFSKDMTLFLDDDGKAYLICSSEKNSTIHINLLSDDFLKMEGTFVRTFEKQWREAPVVFKYKELYYFISSGCSGFSPNMTFIASSPSILGNWEMIGNPCEGPGNEQTFHSQATYILPMPEKENEFILIMDHWYSENLYESTYVWLPLVFDGKEPKVRWYEKWNFNERLNPDSYIDNPRGPVINTIGDKEIDLSIAPDFLINSGSQYSFCGIGWLGYSEGAIRIKFVLFDKADLLTNTDTRKYNRDLLEFWVNYYQININSNEESFHVIDNSGGQFEEQLWISTREKSDYLKLELTHNYKISFASLCDLPVDSKGIMFELTILEGYSIARPIKKGEIIAFAAAILDRIPPNSNKLTNRLLVPNPSYWFDTNYYYRVNLI